MQGVERPERVLVKSHFFLDTGSLSGFNHPSPDSGWKGELACRARLGWNDRSPSYVAAVISCASESPLPACRATATATSARSNPSLPSRPPRRKSRVLPKWARPSRAGRLVDGRRERSPMATNGCATACRAACGPAPTPFCQPTLGVRSRAWSPSPGPTATPKRRLFLWRFPSRRKALRAKPWTDRKTRPDRVTTAAPPMQPLMVTRKRSQQSVAAATPLARPRSSGKCRFPARASRCRASMSRW